MASLTSPIPPIAIATSLIKTWGTKWLAGNKFGRGDSMKFTKVMDGAFASSLAAFLGGIPVVPPSHNALIPPQADCVELGDVRIVGGIRPQNYDVVYRPDGPRVAFDSKTLNDAESIRKNWQNMVNDLATEAATIHTRFPHTVVGFMVVLPSVAVATPQRTAMLRTLERLATREKVLDEAHLAEAIAFVLWDPTTGVIDAAFPPPSSALRVEKFCASIERHYIDRYKGLPPHD